MKKLTKIPAEFSLSKYDVVADFDHKTWFVNLEKRYELFALCNTPFNLLKGDNTDAVVNMQASTRKKVLALLKNPIISTEESSGSLFGLQDDAVVTLKNKDFFTLLMHANFEYEENYQTFVKELTENSTSGIVTRPRNSKLSNKEFWDVDISPVHTAFAQVDLWNSDQKLVEDFKTWVKIEKAKRHIDFMEDKKGGSKIPDKIRKHAPTAADFNQWTENQVLPCLDLIIWASANQCKITDRMLAEALFPTNFETEITIKVMRSTKPKAEELMDSATLMIFANAVKKEIKPESKPFYAEDFLQRIKNGVAASKKS